MKCICLANVIKQVLILTTEGRLQGRSEKLTNGTNLTN